MSDNILQLDQIHTYIGSYHILQGVSFAVPRAQITMLLGRNGAGKTTTLRTIMGLWKVHQGALSFDGQVIADGRRQHSPPDIARAGVAYVPENMGVFGDLTVKENMLLAARGAKNEHHIDSARLEWVFELFPALKKFWLYPSRHLSGGQKQMLSIARAIIEPRQLLLIDEPSKGLAPAIIDNMAAAFLALKKQGVSILLVEQNISLAQAVGDGVAIMDSGQIVYTDQMSSLMQDAALQKKLLGLSVEA